jgi:hypothetical protein
MLESQRKFEAERLSRQMFTVAGDCDLFSDLHVC